MTNAQIGTAIALVVAGWPLYQLVSSGDMNATTALLRGAVVVAACIYGVSLITDLAGRYAAEAEVARKKRLEDLFTEMEGAVADGSLTDPDAPRAGADATAEASGTK